MIQELRDRHKAGFTFFSLVTIRNKPWQNLIIIGLLSTISLYVVLSADELINFRGFHYEYLSMVVLLALPTHKLGKLFHAQTIRRFLPHLYISRFDWDQKGLDLEMERNFEKYLTAKRAPGKAGNLSREQRQAEVKKGREKGRKIYDNFEHVCQKIIKECLEALAYNYPTKILWVMVLFFLALGFLTCFRYCCMDLYENVFTDIGSMKKFQ